MQKAESLKKTVIDLFPLIIILIGVAFSALTLGPYESYDTNLEFEAASNVLKMGVPYVASFGAVIDQPPVGFYTEALLFGVFGLSVDVGVTLVTIFALACTVMVYLLGRDFYGKTAGLAAAALFGLNPWLLVLSRSFLIDTQCLFFSLLCLYLGVLAIRKGNTTYALGAGLVFAAAFLTKFYAVFVLVPLALFYVFSKPKEPKRVLSQIAAFSIPVVFFGFLWYQVCLGRSLLAMFVHNDLADVVPASTHVVTSPFFVANFLFYYTLGVYLIAATVFSLLLGLLLHRYFPKTATIDLTLLVTIMVVLGVNVYLGALLNLNVPYFSAIKYDYQALPFFALLAGSLIAKGSTLLNAAKNASFPKKIGFYGASLVGVLLVFASLLSSMYLAHAYSISDYLQFRVEPQVDYGYALLNPTPIAADSSLLALQYLGFGVVLFGLFWAAGRANLGRLRKKCDCLRPNSECAKITDN